MLDAEGLLVLQATSCNRQVPAKVYEYLRARRPIFAMTDPEGDTAALLRSEGVETIVPLNSAVDIAAGLLKFLTEIKTERTNRKADVSHLSRRFRTKELAALLDSVVGSNDIQPARSKGD